MSAVVCGKRSLFEDLPSSPPASKRICSYLSSSSGHIVQPLLLIDQLVALFPDMDQKLLDKTLEECGDDLDLAIKCLNELCLGCVHNNLESTTHSNIHQAINQSQVTGDKQEDVTVEETSNLGWPADGAGWVELFVREMVSATNLEDARARATRAREVLEKTVRASANEKADKKLQQENAVLKEQLQALIQENLVLKRAVSIQHERQKEFDDEEQEFRQLKHLIPQYQERLKTLEVTNYALAMHLRQAQQENSLPGQVNPDVF